MKEGEPIASRQRHVLGEVCRVLLITGGLILVVFLLLVAVGKFSFDASSHDGLWPRGAGKFGLYDSPLRGLESYNNPVIELIAFTQFCALLMLPVVLIAFKKQLHIAVMPWVLVAFFAMLSQLVSTQAARDSRYLLDSKLPWLLWIEGIMLLGIVLSYAIYDRIRHDKD